MIPRAYMTIRRRLFYHKILYWLVGWILEQTKQISIGWYFATASADISVTAASPASIPSAMSTPVNRGLPTQPAGKPLLESGHEPTNQPDPLSRQGCHGLPPRYTPAGQVWRGAEDRMHAIERPAHGRQAVYQAILNGGWRVFLPWASARELEALIASGPTDPTTRSICPCSWRAGSTATASRAPTST